MDHADSTQKKSKTSRQAEDWNEHEHVSEQTQLEAQRFVDQVGSPGLAIMAIEIIVQRQAIASDTVDSNQTTDVELKSQFLGSLEAFRICLETPIVSSELRDWLTAANCACNQVGSLIGDAVQRHHLQYGDISKDNTDRIEMLRSKDERMLTDYQKVANGFRELLYRAENVNRDELKLELDVCHAVKQSMEFVIAAGEQEVAVATC